MSQLWGLFGMVVAVAAFAMASYVWNDTRREPRWFMWGFLFAGYLFLVGFALTAIGVWLIVT